MPNDKSARELSAHGGDGGGDKAIDLHNDLPTPDLLDEAERIAANQHKDGRYAAALVLRILCHRLAATQQPASGEVVPVRLWSELRALAAAWNGTPATTDAEEAIFKHCATKLELWLIDHQTPATAAHGGSGELSEDAMNDLVEAVEADLGMGSGAWDTIAPQRIVRAIIARLPTPPASAREAEGIDWPFTYIMPRTGREYVPKDHAERKIQEALTRSPAAVGGDVGAMDISSPALQLRYGADYMDGWNSCRDAMLAQQAQP